MKTVNIQDLAKSDSARNKILAGLTLFYMLMNLLNKAFYSTNGLETKIAISGILFGLASAATYSAFILVIDRPFIGLAILIINYISTILAYWITGDAKEALEENTIYICIIIAVLLFNIVRRVANKKKANIFKENRLCINISLPLKLILYSSMLSVVFIIEKNEMFNNFTGIYKFIGAVVICLPVFFTFGIVTTTNIAFDLFIVKIAIEIITFAMSIPYSKFNFIMMLEIIVEILIVCYWWIRYKLLKHEEKEKK